MRTDAASPAAMRVVLAALTPCNRLIVRTCLATGLRVGDVVALRSAQLDKRRATVREAKTGKTRRIYWPRDLWLDLRRWRGQEWVFPGRLDPSKHWTRQAVWRDVKRAAKAFRLPGNIAPHSARKTYAQQIAAHDGQEAARRKLGHADIATTLVYTLAQMVELDSRGLP